MIATQWDTIEPQSLKQTAPHRYLEAIRPMNAHVKARPAQQVEDAALVASGARVIAIETQALQALQSRIDQPFAIACRLLLACQGRVICIGMGKSGHIARKIAATLASTGTPAYFVHPAEASHGDLGMITDADAVLVLSNSGETEEVLAILPMLKRQGNVMVAMTGRPKSTLARHAAVHLDVGVPLEACPLGLAPTASTTAVLAMGDALAVALLEARGFTSDDFARSHPAGCLGRQLLLHIRDVMHCGDEIPCVLSGATLSHTLVEMSHKRLGLSAVVDHTNRLLGVFTDGDLRRALDDSAIDLRTTTIDSLMTRDAKTIAPECLASEAAHLMETHKINALVVTDAERKVVGALNIHDLLRARVV